MLKSLTDTYKLKLLIIDENILKYLTDKYNLRTSETASKIAHFNSFVNERTRTPPFKNTINQVVNSHY